MSPLEAILNLSNLGASLAAAFRGGAHGNTAGGEGKVLKAFVGSGGPEFIKQQMPQLFGIGFTDNAITASLLRDIGEESAKKLERLFAAMSDYERYFFWMTFASVKNSVAVTRDATKKKEEKDGEKTDTASETTHITTEERNDRMETLKMVVEMIGDDPNRDMSEVVNSLYLRRILEKSATMKAWATLSKTFKTSVLAPLGVNTFGELVSSPRLAALILARKTKRNEPIPMNIFERMANASLSGAKPVPEPLTSIGAVLRAFGIPIPFKK